VAECTTHYRRWRWGHATDAPIRRYTHSVRPKRKKPFAADYALLAELGLRRNCVAQLSQMLAFQTLSAVMAEATYQSGYNRRHGIAWAQGICPSKPSDVAMSR
jgi:hypothetical protein